MGSAGPNSTLANACKTVKNRRFGPRRYNDGGAHTQDGLMAIQFDKSLRGQGMFVQRPA
jgi:hypothetical protein